MSSRRPARALPLPPIRSSQATLLGRADHHSAPAAPSPDPADEGTGAAERSACANMLPAETPAAAAVLQAFAMHVLRSSAASRPVERPRPVVLARSACGPVTHRPSAPPPAPDSAPRSQPPSFPPVACSVQNHPSALPASRRPRWLTLGLAALAASLLVAVLLASAGESRGSATHASLEATRGASAATGLSGAAIEAAQRIAAASAARSSTRSAGDADTLGAGSGTIIAIAPPGVCRLWIAGSPFDTSGRARAVVPPGHYLVACQRSGHGAAVRRVRVAAGATKRVVF